MSVDLSRPGQTTRPNQKNWNSAGDETLLRALAGGETEAFDALFARYSGQLLSFLSRLVVSHCDAEDLLQETFLRVVSHAAEFRSGAAFKPWLFTIARNAGLNALKKTRLQAELKAQTDLSGWSPPAGREAAQDPSRHAELREEKARVLSALETLPPLHREILVLIILNGFSYEEAAAITGDPASTLRSRVFHALRKLRKEMEPQMNADKRR